MPKIRRRQTAQQTMGIKAHFKGNIDATFAAFLAEVERQIIESLCRIGEEVVTLAKLVPPERGFTVGFDARVVAPTERTDSGVAPERATWAANASVTVAITIKPQKTFSICFFNLFSLVRIITFLRNANQHQIIRYNNLPLS